MARSKPDKPDTKKAPGKDAKSLSPAKKLSALRDRFSEFKPARVALEEVTAIPTLFIELDWATRVGGWPIKRTCVVHGPSNHGKTVLLLGLAGSFVRAGGMADYVDAEATTPFPWVRNLLGAEIAESDRFIARPPPRSYEVCMDDTRKIHRAFKEAKDAGELPATASLITLIDSLPKLRPEDAIKKVEANGTAAGSDARKNTGADGKGGRLGMIQANMNKIWLNELTPLTYECGSAWTAITRESSDPDASDWDKKAGTDYNLIGGQAVIFDAALRVRVTRDCFITIGEGKEAKIVGERHCMTILKTKVGGKENRATVAYFHTSNGVIAPEGLDRTRDIVELALKLGTLVMHGNTVRWPSRDPDAMFARSRETAISSLRFSTDDLAILEEETRAKFKTSPPVEIDNPEEVAHVEGPSA